MVDESGEAKPADGAPDTVSAAPSDAAAQLAIERGIPVPVQAPISSPEPEAPAAPPVGDPPPPAGEGDRREAVEGGAPAAIAEMPQPEPTTAVEPLSEPAGDEASPPQVDASAPLATAAVAPGHATEIAEAPRPTEPATAPVAAGTSPEAVASAEPAVDPTPSVSDPPPFTGEGDRREAVEGAPPAKEIAPSARAPLAGALLPLLEFTAWRLLELAATIGATAFLTGLLIPAATPADPAILADRLGVTGPLVILSLLIAALIGLPLGYLSARIGGWTDVALRAVTTLGLALNPIWLAMLLVLLLATSLQWLQPGGFIPWSDPVGALTSLLLPALALGLPLAAELATRMRDALTAILAGPAMRTADLRGYSRAEAIRDFALRLALTRTFARLGVPLALLVPMSLVIEAVFYLPGLGRMIFTALSERDFATLQLGLVMLVALVALCRIFGLLLQAVFDPRIARRA